MAQTGLEKIKISDKFYLIPEKKGFKRSYIIFLRILLVSLHRFLADDCLTRASAIAYTNIVSLVPVLTVALALLTISSGFTEKQDELFDSINTFLQKNEIRIDITPYLETLKDIINSATQIGAIGFIVLIFSATAILRTFEAAFNQIWRITTPRPFADKIIFYFFILSIGPLLGAIFTSFAARFADATRASHLYSITRSSDNFLWMAGENGTIVKIQENGKRLAKLKDFKIDYENMYCMNLDKDAEANCDIPKLNKESFVKIRNRKNQLVTISENGVILQSFDLGQTWSIAEIVNAKVLDFTIADENNMFIVLTDGEIINYHNKDKFDKVFVNYSNSEDKVIATKIRFPDPEHGYFLDANGYFWKTSDGGKTFQSIKVTKGTLNLTDLAILDNENYAVVGERGAIYRTHDAGKTWIDISHKRVSYTKIWYMQNEGKDELIVLNDLGSILYSNDLGNKWQLTYTPTNGKLHAMIPINPKFGFTAMNPEDESVPTEEEIAKQKEKQTVGDILAVGEFGKISIGDVKDGTLEWHTIAGGDNIFSLYSFIKTVIPLSAIWIFFMMLYTLIPNTKVPLKASAIGAALTGFILLSFFWAFGIYLRSFATSTMVIYRALAAVPIFLLVVYCFS
ncbi:MAG TPA: YhjD/YihY/BrkB family envelope integrity protein, partial [Leptospiraceae bacterium]|nr:YhjD/YihY/BrkB family envelope integrity protein [Leptospiraceae bacterium]